MPGLRQAGDRVDLDYPPLFVDRVEDAVPPGPQAPQIRRPVRERLRRPRLIGELANSVPGHSGDDVFGEDPTVSRLAETAADRMGKEAALFVASGTMGKLLGLLVNARPGYPADPLSR
jgi:Beta-eliminating lyase